MADTFDLHYGGPGSAKTRSLIEVIKKIHEETGQIANVYTGDGSGQMYRMAMETGHIPQGVIKIIEFVTRDNPFSTLEQLCSGYVPEDENDPKSRMRRMAPQEMKDTGIWLFEGLAVAGNYMMGDAKGGLAQRAADGEVIGQDIAQKITDYGDDKKPIGNFGGNSGGHYGFAQRHLLQNILRTKALPGYVAWTTHERYDDGERGGSFAKGSGGAKYKLDETKIGPEVIGKAMTATISREFGNTFHYTTASKKEAAGNDEATGKGRYKDKMEYRIYTRDHYDPDGVTPFKYSAVVRTMHPEKISDFYTAKAPGQALVELYAALREAK